ncbi:MAG TPA: hypothetical protein VE034_01275 [Burkholderiales bacterium]|nr:hypothetical protein [Burkholderiales bacterium]
MRRAALLFLPCLSFSALAQTVTDVKMLGDKTTYVMRINGTPYVAFTQAQADDLRKTAREREELKQRLVETEEKVSALQRSASVLVQVEKDYAAATAKLRALAEDEDKLSTKFSETAGKLSALNKEYSQLVSDYEALAKKYREIAVRSAPRQPIDLGAGFVHTGDKSHVVGMAGIGIALGVRAWVFGGQSTYGAMLGYSF